MAAVPGGEKEVTLEPGEIVVYEGDVALVCMQNGRSLSLAVYHLTIPSQDYLLQMIPPDVDTHETFKYVADELSKVIAQAPYLKLTDISAVIHQHNAEKFAVPEDFIEEARFLPVVVIHPDYFGIVGTVVDFEEDPGNEVNEVTIMTTYNQVDHLDPSRFEEQGDCRYFKVEGRWVKPYDLQ